MRRTWAEIDLDAVSHNVAALARHVAPAALCAVVKADGYGHGAIDVGRAALAAGARWLAVALVEEGAALRAAGIEAPILLLSEPPAADMADVVALRLRPTLYSSDGIEAAAAAVASAEAAAMPVHLKVDTGMHRVGASPEDAVELARSIVSSPQLHLEGVFTHCAVADEPANAFTGVQLERFRAVIAALEAAGCTPDLWHAANSAAALLCAESRFDLVRCGISIYGIAPAPGIDGGVELRPALSLHSTVSLVKRVEAGEALSYGQRYRLTRSANVATVPIGYADGVRRRLSGLGGEVLIGGKRYPIAGTVTMDQITVDCGDDTVARGAEVVLLGRQGHEQVTADEWAARLDTIAYEIVCGIGARVPRVVSGDPQRDRMARKA
jgi:alanine racemase